MTTEEKAKEYDKLLAEVQVVLDCEECNGTGMSGWAKDCPECKAARESIARRISK